MKNLTTILFCIFLINGFSQTWIDSNAKWTFDYWNVSESGTWRWEYTNDTVIQGKQCEVIHATKYRYGGPMSATLDYGDTYTYQSNDSVFYLKDDNFFLLYDFGAAIGDSWIISIDTTFSACQDTAIVEVVDTGTILINGYNYRTITLETVTESLYALNGLCVEKFGLIPTTYEHNNFGFLPGYQYCDGGPIIDYDMLTFRCYEDSTFPTYNPTNRHCDTLTSASTDEIFLENFNIYPNPAENKLYIDSPNSNISNVEILDMHGRLILKQEYKESIEVSKLKNGIYFIRIIIDDKKQVLKKFVKK